MARAQHREQTGEWGNDQQWRHSLEWRCALRVGTPHVYAHFRQAVIDYARTFEGVHELVRKSVLRCASQDSSGDWFGWFGRTRTGAAFRGPFSTGARETKQSIHFTVSHIFSFSCLHIVRQLDR